MSAHHRHSTRFLSARCSSLPPALLIAGNFDENRRAVRQTAERSGWIVFEASSLAQAAALLRKESIGVVICEESLPDGNWRLVVEVANTLDLHPKVMVACRKADSRLWAEVLNLGGHDLLLFPLDSQETFRLIELAWESQQRNMAAGGSIKKPIGVAAPGRKADPGIDLAHAV